jgi:NAD-dependent SIR2 family protein deacetylase
MTMPQDLDLAAEVISHADALLVAAGAGMGVDSGLPDFRGPEGFWRAYPAYARLGLRFEEMASPDHFRQDPPLGWGFYGHRTNLYRATRPHEGFAILKRWADSRPGGGFVFTSNVDDHFRRAGFGPDQIVECHGSIEWRQCLVDCGAGIFPADDSEIPIDPETFRATGPLPSCPDCGGLARPNILMFGDWSWDSTRTDAQQARMRRWLLKLDDDAKLVIVEVGAGLAVATVRRFTENLAATLGATLIRINLRDPEVPNGGIGLAMGGLDALRAIDDRRSS